MRIPLIISLLFCALSQHCSDALFFQNDSMYYDGDKLIHLYEYTIQNNSQENVISWVDYLPSFREEDPIIHFFFHRKGDFSIANLLTEDVVFSKESPTLGKDFLVRIKPGQSFKYLVLNNENIRDHIFFYKESDIINVIGGPIINNDFFYDGTAVVIEQRLSL